MARDKEEAQEGPETDLARGREVAAEEMGEPVFLAQGLKIQDPIILKKRAKKDIKEKCCCGWKCWPMAGWGSLS